MAELYPLHELPPDCTDLAGGKALSLADMLRAGLPVPPGFCVTTVAMRRLAGRAPADDQALASGLLAAYRSLGGAVAVRSSATAEDGASVSFAGQQETILGAEGDDGVLDAVARCWASLDSDRAAAYRRQQGVSRDGLAMAVVVQRLVDAEVAGVLFTRDPLDATGQQMLVEASWGLGESVVSGRVTPDRYHLDRSTGKLLSRYIALKPTQRTRAGECPVPAELQGAACLDEAQLADLAELGRRIESYFGGARDVEWAWAEGRFWLLQARPITAAGLANREAIRQEEIAAARAKASPRGTVWARFNISEVLPTPTPYTWALVSRMMSGNGAVGQMYRDLGFQPDSALGDESIFDLIAGRPYCNLSREPMLHRGRLPLEHPFDELKADRRRALYPVPKLNPWAFPWTIWLSWPVELPLIGWRVWSGDRTRQHLLAGYANTYREQVAPAFLAEAHKANKADVAALTDQQLHDYLRHWTRRTLTDFARESLKPTALASICLTNLEEKLGAVMPAGAAKALMQSLVMGVHPGPEADLPAAVRALSDGSLSQAEFLARFGHRGPEEMELSRPRWGEAPSLLGRLHAGTVHVAPYTIESRLEACPNLTSEQVPLLVPDVRRLHDYLALRETAKHHLMHGYALIRRALVEIDRRGRLDGGVFFLLPDELPQLVAGKDFTALIAERRQRRSAALALEVPPVLFSDDLEAIGRPLPLDGADALEGVPLSAGVAEGPALVLEHPQAAPPQDGYVLVCPSTDPAWVPLFVHASALVMESGGVLSHGAIVAREFGLPAVAGLPGVVQRLRSGQRLRVDGNRGVVAILP